MTVAIGIVLALAAFQAGRFQRGSVAEVDIEPDADVGQPSCYTFSAGGPRLLGLCGRQQLRQLHRWKLRCGACAGLQSEEGCRSYGTRRLHESYRAGELLLQTGVCAADPVQGGMFAGDHSVRVQ